ncbi:hypothetical protein [Kibdelosporangium phytohabitans]|uniref:Uncharacterized protein n=1 Tax=Kibdelosporangium phytohabitans TaxID=860235 RepID=A0A0N9HNM9_9PSEU|nr:hypothetical protein [Kibdelosporangium phytohabitans]ALG08577.1 hypothetical protein AOZ06_18105 [Kibdelosporangium phytohabitans]MBE1470343.1 hypothetical protein [Kibdelosporangium phytohabitans]
MSKVSIAFDVLHALAVKGMAQAGPLAVSSGVSGDELNEELARITEEGLANHMAGRGLWRITPDGRAKHAQLLHEQLTDDTRQRLRPLYEQFLPLNTTFKETCTRWQIRGGAANDHTDTAYDQGLIGELGEIHAAAAGLIGRLAQVAARFGRYADRLADALTRVRGGEVKAFTGVLNESYHDIWMELHKDLLLSLDIDRATEEARQN